MKMTMRQVNARDLGKDIDYYLELLKEEPLLIAKTGQPVAVLVSVADMGLLADLLKKARRANATG